MVFRMPKMSLKLKISRYCPINLRSKAQYIHFVLQPMKNMNLISLLRNNMETLASISQANGAEVQQ